MIGQAVILAGGKGTRLGKLTESVPKPALSVGGEPFINHLLWNLARHGIRDILVSSGHLGRELEEAMHNAVINSGGTNSRPCPECSVTHVREPSPLGTGGGLRHCLPQLEESFLVLNGDSIFDINYLDLVQLARGRAALALRRVPDTARYGRVELDGERVSAFREKGAAGPGCINGGIYHLSRELVAELPEGPSSLEQDLFPRLAAEGRLLAREYDGFFIDIGIPEDFARAQTAVPAWKRKPALFLDRDGVLNVNYGYVHTPEQWTWCPGAREAVRFANDQGLLVVLVTNQSGIGRGYYDTPTFLRLMDWVRAELADMGAHLDAVYHCPHHPEAGLGDYRVACDCRKPEPGMLLQALREWDIDLERSIMVGDSGKDLVAAERAGIGRSFRFDPATMNLLECVRGLLGA